MLTVEQAAEKLGYTVSNIRTLYTRGKLVKYQPKRRVYIKEEENQDFFERRRLELEAERASQN